MANKILNFAIIMVLIFGIGAGLLNSTSTEQTDDQQSTSQEDYSDKQPCPNRTWTGDCDKGIMGLYYHPIQYPDCPNQRGICDSMEKKNFEYMAPCPLRGEN